MSEKQVYGIVYLTSRIFRGEVVRKYVGLHKLRNGRLEDGYLGSGNLLRASINKHGRENFIRETLEECYSVKELYAAERKWIERLGAVENPLFYNLVEGGNSMIHKQITVYCYDLLGNFVTEFPSLTDGAAFIKENTTTNVVYACKGKKLSAGGYQWRYEKHDKIDPVRKKRQTTKAVDKVDAVSGEVLKSYNSGTEAALDNGVSTANISRCIKTGFLCGGFLWKYTSDQSDPREKYMARPKVSRPVNCFDWSGNFVKSYESTEAAAQACGIKRCGISTAASSNGTRSAGGYKWQYAN